ncbi:MAG: YifB family Mg chelatase-like AAA ATPase [Acidimicrobiia bacterium]|nr:YifB family Mg chelatase-like AAA ATPase [Acidimicrobiia bacterium]
MLATVHSAVVDGVDGIPVRVEVDVRDGLPSYSVVGMPDAACRESRDRVRAALGNTGLRWPQRRITVNLAPSNVRKQGAGLDLPISIAILIADGQLPAEAVAHLGMAGELGLDGSIRPVPGMIIVATACKGSEFLAPAGNRAEVALIRPGEIRIVGSVIELVRALNGSGPVPDRPSLLPEDRAHRHRLELADVRGQDTGRFALEVAAAGGHHLLFVGPPGAGKTMLASRLTSLLPELSDDDAIVATRIHSAAGIPLPPGGLVRTPPFRAPHHAASAAALIGGGGAAARPGEVSVAHGGVLFLDELGEFSVPVLEALRQPLEEGRIRVGRLSGPRVMPARFQLVAATNPCPCGYGTSSSSCRCSEAVKTRYLRRLSGPLIDRFDLRVHIESPDPITLLSVAGSEEGTDQVARRVEKVRQLAAGRGVVANAAVPPDLIDEVAPLTPSGRAVLRHALAQGELTGRGLHRVRLVARTIGDLMECPPDALDEELIDRALGLRSPVTEPESNR